MMGGLIRPMPPGLLLQLVGSFSHGDDFIDLRIGDVI
jgi:hypothetical protein